MWPYDASPLICNAFLGGVPQFLEYLACLPVVGRAVVVASPFFGVFVCSGCR